MRGMVDLNKSGNSSTLSALSAAAEEGAEGKFKYFVKYLETGSPFDPQADDEQEEDVLQTTVSSIFHRAMLCCTQFAKW